MVGFGRSQKQRSAGSGAASVFETFRGFSGRSGENHSHWNEPPLERIEHKTQAFERRRTEQRFVALFTEDHGRWPEVAVDFEVSVADFSCHRRAVSQRERDFAI